MYAQLITPDGVRRGVHTFVVQLRDRATHENLPGVRTGELGPKMGRDASESTVC